MLPKHDTTAQQTSLAEQAAALAGRKAATFIFAKDSTHSQSGAQLVQIGAIARTQTILLEPGRIEICRLLSHLTIQTQSGHVQLIAYCSLPAAIGNCRQRFSVPPLCALLSASSLLFNSLNSISWLTALICASVTNSLSTASSL